MNKNLLAIHGVPRSGTTWAGEVINSSPETVYRFQPLFSYAHKDRLNEKSSQEEIRSFFKEIYETDDDFTCQKEKREAGLLPSFTKTETKLVCYKEVRYHNILENMMCKDDELKLCLVLRNPFSVINSWLKAPREFRGDLGWSAMEEWRYADKKNLGRKEEFHGFEKWKEATKIFLKLKRIYADRVYLLKYRKMIEDPEKAFRALFDFLDLQFTKQTQEFVRNSTNSHSGDSYSIFRKGQTDCAWKESLPDSIRREIEFELEGSELLDFI